MDALNIATYLAESY